MITQGLADTTVSPAGTEALMKPTAVRPPRSISRPTPAPITALESPHRWVTRSNTSATCWPATRRARYLREVSIPYKAPLRRRKPIHQPASVCPCSNAVRTVALHRFRLQRNSSCGHVSLTGHPESWSACFAAGPLWLPVSMPLPAVSSSASAWASSSRVASQSRLGLRR